MGNSQNKNNQHRNPKQIAYPERNGQSYSSQFSLSQFVGNLSGRSLVSVTSNQSVYSTSRPWSRVSRRRWNNTTLNNPLDASKTAWPVTHKESIFLPEFRITTDLIQKDFEIQGTISKGAFGEVCKVKKISADKEYALKVLSKSQIVSQNAVRQVKEEARIQEVCGHHSFIVGAVSRWQTKKRLYIVSEYIPGGELLALLDKYGKLPEELVKVFIAEIAIAIDFLHNAGVVYRDLKPENILLDSECHIQLIDFGLSKWLSFGAKTTTLCGTLKYMAPEVLSREPYGHAVDWWSLGVLACRMLTNEYPTPAIGGTATIDRLEASTSVDPSGAHVSDVELMDVGGKKVTAPYREGHLRHELARGANHLSIECPAPLLPAAGTLPQSAGALSGGARALLLRLLERDPRLRLRSVRQLQQTAFYMGYNFEHVKSLRVSPKSILDRYFPNEPVDSMSEDLRSMNQEVFASFDQPTLI